MATTPAADVSLNPITGDARPLEDWITTFHLVLVVLDPYTHESSWLIDTAGKILKEFTGADCRVAWLVAGTDDEARQFLAKRGYDPQYGARPLKRLIQREVQDPLAMRILEGEFAEGTTVHGELAEDGEGLVFH